MLLLAFVDNREICHENALSKLNMSAVVSYYKALMAPSPSTRSLSPSADGTTASSVSVVIRGLRFITPDKRTASCGAPAMIDHVFNGLNSIELYTQSRQPAASPRDHASNTVDGDGGGVCTVAKKPKPDQNSKDGGSHITRQDLEELLQKYCKLLSAAWWGEIKRTHIFLCLLCDRAPVRVCGAGTAQAGMIRMSKEMGDLAIALEEVVSVLKLENTAATVERAGNESDEESAEEVWYILFLFWSVVTSPRCFAHQENFAGTGNTRTGSHNIPKEQQ